MSDMPRGIAYPLYERVKREMALQGWTATRMRRESGIARSTLAKWETQSRPPLASTVVAVADALGLDRETALQLAGILPPASDLAMPDDERRSAFYGNDARTAESRGV